MVLQVAFTGFDVTKAETRFAFNPKPASISRRVGTTMKTKWITSMATTVALTTGNCLLAQDWPQWRGVNRNGKVGGFTAPQTWLLLCNRTPDTMKTLHHLIVTLLVLLSSGTAAVFGQMECTGTGNLRGIRVDGELMAFSTSIRAVVPTAPDESQGGRGSGGGGQFFRDGGALTVTGSLTGGAGRGGGPGGGRFRGGPPAAGVSYRATYKDVAPGTVEAEIQISATTNTLMSGVFFSAHFRLSPKQVACAEADRQNRGGLKDLASDF